MNDRSQIEVEFYVSAITNGPPVNATTQLFWMKTLRLFYINIEKINSLASLLYLCRHSVYNCSSLSICLASALSESRA